MWQTSLSVWFVCKLCRGSFGQVDAFIEHKKQKHFTQFQNTTCIVFEERELSELCPFIIKVENQLVDEFNELPIQTEVNDDNPINPVSSEIIEEPISDPAELKSELIPYESEVHPGNENNFVGLKLPDQNPYVLLKRLTSGEIQRVGVPKHQFELIKYEQEEFVSKLEPSNLSASNNSDLIEEEKTTECQPSVTATSISTERDLQFECKLCSKQLESAVQLRIHVGICALYHEDRNRFCVTCNRKFHDIYKLKLHRLRIHGTEEDKLSLFKFKCHVCPKQFQRVSSLRFHLKSHKKTKEQVETSASKSLKCSQPNCGKEFRDNSALQRHISSVHLGLKPFSCPFPNCNKTFTQKISVKAHCQLHTGERPYKCNVDNCTKAFRSSSNRNCTIEMSILFFLMNKYKT